MGSVVALADDFPGPASGAAMALLDVPMSENVTASMVDATSGMDGTGLIKGTSGIHRVIRLGIFVGGL